LCFATGGDDSGDEAGDVSMFADDEAAEEAPVANTRASAQPALVTASPAPPNFTSFLMTWNPIYALSHWTGGDMDEHVTVAVLLPSGISARDDSQVRVSENHQELQVKVSWPHMMSSVAALHALWQATSNALPSYHPKIVGFHNFFTNLRGRESDKLVSEATIRLPIKVQKIPTEFVRIGDPSGARILYVTLHAIEIVDYKDVADGDFVIIDGEGKKVST